MSSLNILVYDDQLEIANELARRIRGANGEANVTPAGRDDLLELINLIRDRRSEWRDTKGNANITMEHPADKADVIVLDYDMFQYADATGSQLAYNLRCFSQCGFIVVLNGYRKRNVFDASLCSSLNDFADLHESDVQIGNAGLWNAPFTGYRPWYWPTIPEASSDFEQCVAEVIDNFDEPILGFLELDGVAHWIPHRAREFLTREPQIEHVTFREFIESDRGKIDPKDDLSSEQLARVAAARIRNLLNSLILPEQSVLIDAPHLVSRFPSLLGDGRHKIRNWNELCNPIGPEIDGLLNECIRDQRFARGHWLWRPAWLWPKVKENRSIEEVNSPWFPREERWVFCENISRFAPVEFTQEFRAFVSPPFMNRFVFKTDLVDAIEEMGQLRDESPLDFSEVEYVPEANFLI